MKQKLEKHLQKLADYIINKLRTSKSKPEFDFWLNLGYSLNDTCLSYNIYLN